MEKIKNAIKSAYQWLNKEGGMRECGVADSNNVNSSRQDNP